MGKLGPTWDVPYKVTSIAGVGAYQLEDLDEKPVAMPWNVFNLKKCYFWLLYKKNMHYLYFYFV